MGRAGGHEPRGHIRPTANGFARGWLSETPPPLPPAASTLKKNAPL